MRAFAFTSLFVLVATTTACTAEHYTRSADREVARLLARKTAEVVGGREESVVRPEATVETTSVEPTTHRVLDLRGTVAVAITSNRDYQTRLETLYLTALGLLGTQHTFSPRLTAVLSYVFSDLEDVPYTSTTAGAVGASQILPWGGTLAVDATAGRSASRATSDSYDASVGVRLTQPLLRGAGYEVSHEALIQAERNMIYEVRNFELFREDFTIEVASQYYGLVQRGRRIANQEENLERALFDRAKAQALFEVGRVSELEVLRAQRQELNSQNDLLEEAEDYALALDDFRIFLGLPDTVTIEIADEPPPYVPVDYDVASAVATAIHNRLDLMNRREQLEDTARSVRIARNGLLPDLTLDLAAGLDGGPEGAANDLDLDRTNVSGALTLGLPVDRVLERNAYRSSQISHERARRDLEEFEDSIGVQIRSAIRELQRRQTSVEITRDLITGEEKNKRIAELQFERGTIDNRELVDAEQSLLDARNSLIDEQVNYELARLRLLRDLGILFIDDEGMWKE
jgi:outer membrane protein TolC